jgi:hypothetical protein
MLRDNLVELIEPMLNSAGANPLALTHHQIQASGDRLPCLENPRPKGAESSLTENVTSPFQAEPAHKACELRYVTQHKPQHVLPSYSLPHNRASMISLTRSGVMPL